MKEERSHKDLVNNEIVETRSNFVEKLTHDCYVVQVERITNKYKTKLDKLLSLFEQTNFVDDRKIVKEFTHEIDNDDIKLSADILHFSGTNTEERKKIEAEQEAWRSVNAMFDYKEQEYLKELAGKDKSINKKNKLIEELVQKLSDKK